MFYSSFGRFHFEIFFLSSFLKLAQEKLQSPLQVLMCLAVDNGPNLSVVRDYFLQVFQKDNESARNVCIRSKSCDPTVHIIFLCI